MGKVLNSQDQAKNIWNFGLIYYFKERRIKVDITKVRFLTVEEVSKILNLSKGKVYKMIKEKELPYVLISGCFRIPEERLEELISTNFQDIA